MGASLPSGVGVPHPEGCGMGAAMHRGSYGSMVGRAGERWKGEVAVGASRVDKSVSGVREWRYGAAKTDAGRGHLTGGPG